MVAAVKRNVAGLIVVFVGAAILQVAASDTYLRYVKPSMRLPLLAAGLVLVVLAVLDVFADSDSTGKKATKKPVSAEEHEAAETGHVHLGVIDSEHSHGHSHHGLPRAAWLLLLPIFALLVVDPPALGADAAQRQSPVAAKPVDAAGVGNLLPQGEPGTPVALPVRDYSVWAVWETDSMRNRSFKLTGFVTPDRKGKWYLTRIGITCCVADAQAFMVEIHGRPAPPRNQWVEITGNWAEPTKYPEGSVAALDATAIRAVKAPADPYE